MSESTLKLARRLLNALMVPDYRMKYTAATGDLIADFDLVVRRVENSPPAPALTEHFLEAFSGRVGTPAARCKCGRMNYNGSGEFMDPGELEAYEAEDDAVAHEGAVSPLVTGHVYGCVCLEDGRHTLRILQQQLIANEQAVVEFLRLRAHEDLEAARHRVESLGDMAI